MENLDDVIRRLLLAADRGDLQAPVITPSEVARASGRSTREVRAALETLADQGTLQRTPYLLAACLCCGQALKVPAPVTVGYGHAESTVPLQLAAVWCPGCRRLRAAGELHPEPAYASAPPGAPD
jgi:hypothetical protein